MLCPLCTTSDQTAALRGADERDYHHCGVCHLIFADPVHRLPEAQERAHYQTHENSIDQPGYVRFLSRVLEPMLPHLDSGMRGLDYGCGPGPTLSRLVRRQGIACDDYDPLFADRPLRPPYDFLFSTECFEHFHHPAAEIGRIHSLLKPGSLLGIMTERWTTLPAFSTWYYTRDPTHVSFYHAETFAFLCDRFGFVPVWSDEQRVTILRRTPHSGRPLLRNAGLLTCAAHLRPERL